MHAIQRWAALAALCLATAASAAEPVVGTATLQAGPAARRFAAELWFEAAPGTRAEDLTLRAPLRAIALARGAAAAAGEPRPLVVLSHGNWGTRFSQGWLATRLVRAGYVVLSVSHPGTLADDQSAAGRVRLWDRSRDVSAALDTLLADRRWAALVDAQRIGFAGHSFGGWTGVSLAGGRWDPQRQRAACAAQTAPDFYCDALLKDMAAAPIALADAGGSFRDPRIKAFYLMASGPAAGFSSASLAAIKAPFVVDTAAADEVLPPAAHSAQLARGIAGARSVVRPVGHFAYVPECKPVIGRLLARAAGVPICDEAPGVDRAVLHERVAADVLAFFGAQLKAAPQ